MFFDVIHINIFFLLSKFLQNTLQQITMQGSSKVKDDSQLPKIKSQHRIHTANDRRVTEEDMALTNRPLSNNCRTRSLRAFTTKSIKYESTGNVYNKKIEDFEKQTFNVDRQIKSVEDQIKQLRQTIGNSRKQVGISRMNQSSTSYFSKISNRKIVLGDHEAVKSELKNIEAKILNYRNKIDSHLQKNKAIQQQIDAYRKEISTLKNINIQLQTSFKQTSRKYEEQMELSKILDADIAEKTELTHRKKVQNMHQKAQMIKQYDVILKNLDKQLNTEKIANEEEKSYFYLTDIANTQNEVQKSARVNQKPIRNIFSGKKPKINEIREKLKSYERQFEELKTKIGSQNIEEITKKFTEEYQNNFRQYNFINEMYRQYEEANDQQFQLLQKKNELLKQLESQQSASKVKEILEMRTNIQRVNKKKENIQKDMLLYNKLALQLKVYLNQFLKSTNKITMQIFSSSEDLNDNAIASSLHKIYENYSKELGLLYSQKNKQRRFTKNSILGGKESIDDLIEEVKKASETAKDNKLMTREQLQKNTIEMKEKKLENSLVGARFKTKKQIEKNRIENSKNANK